MPSQEEKTIYESEVYDFKDQMDSTGKLVWLMENSRFFKYSILGYASKFIMAEEETIQMSIKLDKSKKEDNLE